VKETKERRKERQATGKPVKAREEERSIHQHISFSILVSPVIYQ
jgi:hypothetical protein